MIHVDRESRAEIVFINFDVPAVLFVPSFGPVVEHHVRLLVVTSASPVECSYSTTFALGLARTSSLSTPEPHGSRKISPHICRGSIHTCTLRPPQASSLELVFDTMTCLFQHLGSRAVPMLPFLGSVLHMLTYSLPAILGPVGAAEESPLETDDESEKDSNDGLGVDAEPKSGAQATATYYAAVQVGSLSKKTGFGVDRCLFLWGVASRDFGCSALSVGVCV